MAVVLEVFISKDKWHPANLILAKVTFTEESFKILNFMEKENSYFPKAISLKELGS